MRKDVIPVISKKRSFKVLRLFICLAVVITASSMFLTIEPMASENSEDLLPALEQEAEAVPDLEVVPLRAQLLHTPAAAQHAADVQPEIVSMSVTGSQVDEALTELSEITAKLEEEDSETEEEPEVLTEETYADEETGREDVDYEDSYKEAPSYTEPETPEIVTPPAAPSAPSLPADANGYSDLDYLAAICQIEAGYNYDGCLAVANVVLNRVNAGYAGSIYDVIYQPYQFATGQMNYYLANGTGSPAREAAAAALAGSNNIGGYLNFNGTTWLNPDTLGRPYVVIGGNCFY